MTRGSKFKFKRVYPYICKVCKKKRGTRIYERRLRGICTLCKRQEVNKNQLSLLERIFKKKDE